MFLNIFFSNKKKSGGRRALPIIIVSGRIPYRL